MSDVRTQDPPVMNRQERTGPNPPGDFIWYELMTTDADAAKDFYDAVVGWDFGEAAPDAARRFLHEEAEQIAVGDGQRRPVSGDPVEEDRRLEVRIAVDSLQPSISS